MRVNATARVRVMIEVDASAWGGECSVDQVFKQAKDTAVGRVMNLFQVKPPGGMRLVGDPIVTAIFTVEGNQE